MGEFTLCKLYFNKAVIKKKYTLISIIRWHYADYKCTSQMFVLAVTIYYKE